MENVVMIIPRIPNPRTLRRINVLEDGFNITLLYWDRCLSVQEGFYINRRNIVKAIEVRAPQGKPLKRIIPLSKFIKKSLSELKSNMPLILHVENLDMLFVAWMHKIVHNERVTIVYEVADLPKYAFLSRHKPFKNLVSRALQCIERQLIKHVSKIILTSPYFWYTYYSTFMDDSKYLFIPNAPYKKLFNTYRKQNNEVFTIGFIGSVRYVNQLKMLVDVVGYMEGQARVFIAGSGPGYEEINQYVMDKPWVEMYGPYNYEKEIVSLYQKVDCVYSVYDSKLDNVRIALPNRLYEAIVCELPIIAAKGTALGQFVEEENVGATVSSESPDDLKELLASWVSNSKLIQEYTHNCSLIKDDYYYENNSHKLLDMYKKLAK